MNFCAPCLKPSISVNKPEADGKEVENLVSENPSLRERGYRSEYFTRPPVDITLSFKVSIDISHIKLNPNLDQKSSIGFSIFTQPENASKKIEKRESCNFSAEIKENSKLQNENYNTHIEQDCATSSNSHSNIKSLDCGNSDDVYLCLGTFFTKGEDVVLLKNHHYKHWMSLKMPRDESWNNVKFYQGSLKHPNRQALRCVKKIIIRILKTVESGPPVLKSLEVWGQPGISASKSLRKEVLSCWLKRTPPADVVSVVPRIYNSTPECVKQDTSTEGTSNTKDSFEIPEDFLDPLTCDIMTVPLLLPSGQSIDADTLDRFIANEALWGRPASDPFTGIPFKPGHVLTPNAPLKARIDRFLLLNADQPLVQTCGRTLPLSRGIEVSGGFQTVINNCMPDITIHGVKRKYSSTNITSEHEDVVLQDADDENTMKSKGVGNRSDVKNDDGLNRQDDVSKKNVFSDCKPKKCNLKGNALNKFQDDSKVQSSSFLSEVQPKNYSLKSSAKLTASSSSNSHHSMVRMIGNALSYTRQKPSSSKSVSAIRKPTTLIQGDAKPEAVSAIELASRNSNINCHCGEKSELYSLPCNHVICRGCLLLKQMVSAIECLICQKHCKRSEIIKYHRKSIFFEN